MSTTGSNEIGAALHDSLSGSVRLPFNDAERKFQATNKRALKRFITLSAPERVPAICLTAGIADVSVSRNPLRGHGDARHREAGLTQHIHDHAVGVEVHLPIIFSVSVGTHSEPGAALAEFKNLDIT